MFSSFSVSHIVQYINFPILLFYGFSIPICFSMCNSCLEPSSLLFLQFVPLSYLASWWPLDLLPVMESLALALGSSQSQAANHLRQGGVFRLRSQRRISPHSLWPCPSQGEQTPAGCLPVHCLILASQTQMIHWRQGWVFSSWRESSSWRCAGPCAAGRSSHTGLQ